jgi:thiosulfate/3-mercaptopyruvate sulfurtransferase
VTGASPLVTVDWLAAHLADPHVVVADVRWYLQGKRGIDAYRAGHVPGAVFADVDGDLSSPKGASRPGRHPLPDAEHFADFLARTGVGPRDLVVAYDDSGGGTAARLWWLLRYFAHDGGRVLDGGIQAWTAAGHPLDTNAVERRPAEKMRLVPRAAMVVDKRRVRELSEGSRGTLLDARASERFEGTVEPVDARPGHIPGAKSAPFAGNLEAPGGRFLPAAALEARRPSSRTAAPG